MRSIQKYITVLICALVANASFGQTVKTDTIKVWGNCGMCKATIEKAAKKAGAKTATWNEETKMLNLGYDQKKSSLSKIQLAIAKAGYDTQDNKGDDNAYKKLHGCCQYDRKPVPMQVTF